ncbi:YheU family protein [Vibrio sp.]|uniref:YheU family protein n=1 Tax=Vibrio sp. TaxID=678 RepID=UPI003AA8E90B
MIIPWQDIDPDTLDNLIKEFILREGTDYGMQETSLKTKIKQVKGQLKSSSVVIVFSELHESVDIKPINELN